MTDRPSSARSPTWSSPADGGGLTVGERRIVVVGGGISGLTTALTLAEQWSSDDIAVELFEADDRLGGKLLTTPFAGLPAVDEGSDAFLARVPEASELAKSLGLALTSPTAARAAVWRDRLHPIPAGLALGVPGGVAALATSRLLSVRGKVRVAVEPLLPRSRVTGDAIGPLIRRRFGDEVHERLVDALVGSIYAADTDRLSLAAVPQLAALARHRSLLLGARAARRAAPASTAPLFVTPRDGMGAFVRGVTDAATACGVAVRLGRPVSELARDGNRWRVDGRPAEAVVLATPAAATAPLVAQSAPEAARLLATMDHAGVILVTLAVSTWPERLHGCSGYLVPKPVQRTVTAVSFGSQKWAHWRPANGDEVVRVSVGRDGRIVDGLDDDEVVRRVIDDVGHQLGLDVQPTAVRISRWPAAFPQYRPGHLDWRAAVEGALPAGLYVTGASYGGIGVPACIVQAQATARVVLAGLTS